MKRGMRFALLVLCILILGVGAAWAQQPGQSAANNYVQNFDNGKVDWQTGMITAVGIGAPPANPVNMAQARAMAKRAALVVARRNLLEIIQGVQIDSSTTVENFMVSSDVVVSQVKGFLQNSQILDTAYMSDGSVEVTVGMTMRGGLSEVLLPPAAPEAPAPAPAAPVVAPEPAPVAPAPAPAAPPAPIQAVGGAKTGLIIDARGLGAKPAMSPRLLDENGVEVYGSAMVSREYAIQQGMVGYAKDPVRAAANPRVANSPLTVKAVSTEGKAKTNLVLSSSDADKIRALSQNENFLEKCRVMVVLD